MTREDLISHLSERLGWAEPSTKKALEALIDTIVEELMAGNRIDLGDFGLFQARKRSEYILVDRETNERYLMPPSIEVVFEAAEINPDLAPKDHVVGFIPDESLEKEVNSSFALFEPALLNEGVQFPDLPEVYTDQPEDESKEEPPTNLVETIPEETLMDPVEEFQEQVLTGPAEEETEGEPLGDWLEKTPEKERIAVEPSIDLVEESAAPVIDPVVSTEEAMPPVVAPLAEEVKKILPNPTVRQIPGRKRKQRTSIWMPVLGGVAIALAVLFFFKATRAGKTLIANKNTLYSRSVKNHVEALPSQTTSSRTEETIKPEQDIPLQKLSGKKIRLEEGKTLRLLALDHFGNREFWVYIYLENKDRIKNPNTIPLGMELLLPDPSKYGINPNSPESIAKAKLLGNEVLNIR